MLKLVSLEDFRKYLAKWFPPPSTERIMELVYADLIPHARIDGGEVAFQQKIAGDWVKENLIQFHDGDSIPVQLGTVGQGRVVDLPEALRGLAHRLMELPLGACAPCIYFLIRGGRVIYVGQSVSLHNRLSGHYGKKFDRVLYITVPSSSLNRIEGALIRSLRPELNGNLGPCSPVDEVLAELVSGELVVEQPEERRETA